MKKTFTLIIGIICSITILKAQEPIAPPQAFSYVATIMKGGTVVANKTVTLKVSILLNNASGMAKYIEKFTAITNSTGQINIEIGHGVPQLGYFPDIDWSADKYFLKVEVDTKGGTNYQDISTTQLLSVPYALYSSSSKPSGNAGGDLSGTYPNPTITEGAVNTSKLANSAVTSSKIQDLEVATSDIADNAISSDKIIDGAINTNKLAENAVTSSKIQDLQVSTSDIGNQAVTTEKITDGAVTLPKINSSGAATGNVITFNGSTPVWQTPSAGGLVGSGTQNTIALFADANTLGNSNIYQSGGKIGIGASPEEMETRFLVQHFSIINSPIPYVARFQVRAPTIPATISDLAYIKTNGESYFRGPVKIGLNSETVIESDGSANFSKSLKVGQNSISILGIMELTGVNETGTMIVDLPQGWSESDTRVLSAEWNPPPDAGNMTFWIPFLVENGNGSENTPHYKMDGRMLWLKFPDVNYIINWRVLIMRVGN